ncbi:hypothetical protein LP420_04930 [Massilia sp. B-10]|nr:hypothetical protein LP420_04930 [Massilia sp. B-10]
MEKTNFALLRAWIREQIENETEALRRIRGADLTPMQVTNDEREQRLHRLNNTVQTLDEFDELR